jgi:cobalt-zinc-cadmium efflux system outer membrane protein
MGRVSSLRSSLTLLFGLLLVLPAAAQTPLSLPDAVRYALEHNPELATFRQQNGIAAAAVVIARTYPFNPIGQALVMGANGPESAGVTNKVFNEHIIKIDVELHGQRKHRMAAAQAALSRTEWEIAARETDLAIRLVRAFQAVLYQRERVRFAQASQKFQEEAAERAQRLAEQGLPVRGELLLARADLGEARAAVGPARAALDQATYALRRLLGVVDEEVAVDGELAVNFTTADAAALATAALENRPDLKALRLAIDEAEARLKLEISNRWGNPSIGPAFEYNETRAYFTGAAVAFPIPVLNTRRGEIQQRQAERDRARLALQQAEIQVQQDVRAALVRVADAQAVVHTYRDDTLPALEEMRKTLDKFFNDGAPGVDLRQVLEVRRRILRARGLYLDALWELSQAQADLAAALGDPTTTWPQKAE